ncbi:MAG: repeat containing protein, partial [Bryobacterales bacterium]|nr:repeat containing protein [Bryobacterales bacterium]
PDLTQTQPLTTAANLQTPIAVSSDGTRMFVADLGQNRILVWNTIPTSNGAPADVVIGQPNMTSFAENNSANFTDHTPILCASNGTNTTVTPNVPTFPQRCAATMSFPRFVISDGKRLYVADGGNDRVLIYKTIPTTNGARADIILGQPDEFSDDTGFNPDGTNAVQTPTSLAWDGSDLYVSDGFNRRVVIFSPAVQSVPLDGIRNAGSLEIYAIGSVTLSGTPTAKDTITITIAGTDYTYTVKDKDTLENAIQGLVLAIDKAPDPNVIATANLSASAVVVTAKKPGAPGGDITLAVKNSTNATIIGAVSGATLNIYLENPSQIAPGTLIRIVGTNLCDSTVSADFTKVNLPTSLAGCSVYVDGVAAPLLYVSPTQINAQVMYEAQDRTSISTWVRKVARDGSVIASTPIATTIVPQNPGLFAQEGNDPRPGIIFHGSSSAFDLIGVDGSAQEGDVANIVVAGNTYTYTVKKGDTLAIIRDALIALINSKPDPLVHASIANEYTRIALNANVPGPAGEGITATVSVSTDAAKNTAGAALLLTAYNPTLCCSNVQGAPVNSGNPAVPGEMLYTFATGLGVPEPNNVDTGRIFTGGNSNAPKVFVDSILTAGTTANVVSVGLLPGTAGVYYVQFQLNSGLASNTAAQMTIAQQAFVSNVVTFPVAVPGLVSQLVIAPEFYAVDAGVPLTYRVTALDYKGNLATAYTGPLHITTTDTAATVPGDFSLSSGTATFQMTFAGKGLQAVTVTDPTITTINVTAPSVTVR